ncbi:type II toxin-antitoxin system RelE/ParE family toxin [Aureitalea marina]|uniref:Addiction module toxin RelE n=1 Tax=Aureitalea marina TaxID=930804 RepID=A0A2S7KSN3_9FLAO|nr:type II toxin-antitoxin system RelE/ParE family toxin [Aureitalea marina]PQB05617.1 addiction module toxin RelE [Aureitalea marina]
MKARFEVVLLEEAIIFLDSLDGKTREKILFNLDNSRFVIDPKLFKKLAENVWEFRTIYKGISYRLFAFWDKRDNVRTLVIVSHGFKKKMNRVPIREIRKTQKIRLTYINNEN